MAKEKQITKFNFKKYPKKVGRFLKKYHLPLLLSFVLLILVFLTYQLFITNKFYPITFIGDQNISFLNKTESQQILDQQIKDRLNTNLDFSFGQETISIYLKKSLTKIDYSPLEEVFTKTHTGTAWEQIVQQFQNLIHPKKIQPNLSLDLEKQFEEMAKEIEKEPKNAELIFGSQQTESSISSQIQIKEGELGLELDKDALKEKITKYLLGENVLLDLPTKSVPPKITSQHVKLAKRALEISENNSLNLKFEGNVWVLDTKQLLALLDLTYGESLLDKEKTSLFIARIASTIDQDVQEGLFEFNPENGRVNAFKPSQEGRQLDQEKTFQILTQAATRETERQITLPVSVIKPKVATQDVNNLGIKELLGRGVSHFVGSIPNRIYNVGLTAQKINGVLIPPGEIFSFNKTVGDISAATGFKQAYVIKEGRTVLDDGGGVCQDSTTLFRAVLNAGLPVVKRVAHAYRVGYYEQGFSPGLDATVYYPSVDFQFKNDTAHHILVQAHTEGTTLYVDLYGTSDGRAVTLTKPIISSQTPPPPELRQDDPTLPKGTVKQVDWAAAGAVVSFNRTVTKNGEEIIKEIWKSNYKPWQAVYLVGTKEN